jgi:hypothetical protein
MLLLLLFPVPSTVHDLGYFHYPSIYLFPYCEGLKPIGDHVDEGQMKLLQ